MLTKTKTMPVHFGFCFLFFEDSIYTFRLTSESTKKAIPRRRSIINEKKGGVFSSGSGFFNLIIYPMIVPAITMIDINRLKIIVVPSKILVER